MLTERGRDVGITTFRSGLFVTEEEELLVLFREELIDVLLLIPGLVAPGNKSKNGEKWYACVRTREKKALCSLS